MSQGMIEIVSPMGKRASKKSGLARRKRDALQGLRIGLLDNNKPNTDKFLEFVGELLKCRNDAIELIPKRKMSRTEADCLPELIAAQSRRTSRGARGRGCRRWRWVGKGWNSGLME